MKLGQKELNSLTMLYGYYESSYNENEENKDIFYGIKRTIITLGIEDEVENNWYKINHNLGIKQIETIEKLIKIAYPMKKKFLLRDIILREYLEELQFMDRLTSNEKIELENSIKYLFQLNEDEKKFKEKYNLNV